MPFVTAIFSPLTLLLLLLSYLHYFFPIIAYFSSHRSFFSLPFFLPLLSPGYPTLLSHPLCQWRASSPLPYNRSVPTVAAVWSVSGTIRIRGVPLRGIGLRQSGFGGGVKCPDRDWRSIAEMGRGLRRRLEFLMIGSGANGMGRYGEIVYL